MVRQLITFLFVVGLLGTGAYLLIYKRGAVERSAKGYKPAETPQEAADFFKKAITEREFHIAADYCTKDYAEQMRRCSKAANEYAVAMDALVYQMKERSLIRDELKAVFLCLDPFPVDFQITVGKDSGGAATAVIAFNEMDWKGDQPNAGKWNLKPEIMQVYTRSFKYTTAKSATVGMKKDGQEGWKFDFPADSALQARVGYMNDKYKNYVNPFKVTAQEVKNDPTTKEDVTGRLKGLLEQAAKE